MSGIMSMLLGAKSAIATAVDEFFNRVTLLLPGDGTNGAQNNTFLDSSTNNFTITRNGNSTQGTFSPFSQTGWSNYFDGNGDYVAFTSIPGYGIGTGNFSVQTFVNFNSTSGSQRIFCLGVSGTDGIYVQFAGGQLQIDIQNTRIIAYTWTPILGTWYQIDVVRAGTGTNQTTLYINGSSVATGTSSGNVAQNPANIGGLPWNGSFTVNGYISNFRFSNIARTISQVTTNYSSDANTLLLTAQSNRFVDNSSTGNTFTIGGTPSVQAFSPFAPTDAYSATTHGGSGYFDATGDYLTGSTSLSSSTSMSTFTIEGWFYPTSFASLIWFIGDMVPTSNSNALAVDISTGGAVELYWFDGAVKRCTSTSLMRLNQWNWFSIVVNSNAITIYVNSTTAGQSGTTTLTNRNQTVNFAVGANNNSGTPNGYIGSLRWSNGVARTISSIPTAPYTSDSDTRLLLNFTNAGITDATSKNDLETVGNAQISTTQSKWGGSSISFDGTGDWLLVPHSAIQMLGTGNFTIELWVYRNASGTYGLVGKGTGTTGWLVSLNSSNQVVFTFGSSTITSTGTVSSATWTYIAVVREGTGTNQTKIYINGSNDGTGTVSTDFNQTNAMYVGADRTGGSAFNGYIDDLRITRGQARYTANFTAPTAAFAVQ